MGPSPPRQGSAQASARLTDVEARQEAVRALANALEGAGFTPRFNGNWSDLVGCLNEPCALDVDPAIAASAEQWAIGRLELGLGTRGLFVQFLEENVNNDLSLYERSNYVDWLFESAGEGLVK